MNKINIFGIVIQHFDTLRDDISNKVSLGDYFTFLGLPFLGGVLAYFAKLPMPENLISILVAIFSIFAALLFSSQIALFSLIPRRPCKVEDPILQHKRQNKFLKQKEFFKQINANTSYLILVASIALLIFLLIEILPISRSIEGAVAAFTVSHFFLSLMMMIKRTSIAFRIGHELRD